MNMSYCRYRNTLEDLKDCRDQIVNEYDDEDGGLSEDEADAKERLIRVCQEIAAYAERYMAGGEND